MFRHRLEKTIHLVTLRPQWPFLLQLLAWSPLVLLADRREVASFYLLALPGLAILSLALNLSLAHGVFTAFRMDEATRRNHALEHATINVLRARGLGRGVSGRAGRTGFRIAGVADRRAIASALAEVLRHLGQGTMPFVSVHCGSNRLTAQGLGIILLAFSVLVSLVLQPPFWARIGLLSASVLVFAWRRHSIGNWVQRRYFMSTNFAEAGVRSIEKVKREIFERPPVHFVRTVVWD